MQVPEEAWEALKKMAEKEGRPMAQILSDIIFSALPEEERPPDTNECVFCGAPTATGRRICDDCYFDPDIIRPQVFGPIYYHFSQAIAPDAHMKGTFDEFIQWLSEKIAKDFYGVTDAEWEVWQEWLKWRQAFNEGRTTKDDPEWRRFVVSTNKDGFAGNRAAWRTLTLLFEAVLKE